MGSSPQRLYRLWCGKKRYTHWLPSKGQVIDVALRHGLAFEAKEDQVHLGPLTWIEHGERARPKARTISLGRLGRDG